MCHLLHKQHLFHLFFVTCFRLYCATDTVQLLDCVVELRNTLYDISGLDIAHYIGVPAFGLDFMLRYTKAELQILSDPEMVYMLERG